MFYNKVISITAALSLAAIIGSTSTAYAQTQSPTGKVKAVFFDGEGYLIEMHQMQTGPNIQITCGGSNKFRIPMTTPGYKELVATALAAYLNNKWLGLWVKNCGANNVNIVWGGGSWH